MKTFLQWLLNLSPSPKPKAKPKAKRTKRTKGTKDGYNQR
jgi:hypothetical protein